MATTVISPTTIVCGVNCDCAPKRATVKDCSAKGSCTYASKGMCSCEDGMCVASKAKGKCARAINGKCDCGTGNCKIMEEARTVCSTLKLGKCSCEPGMCANLAASLDSNKS